MRKYGFFSFTSFLVLNFLFSLAIGLGYFPFAGSHPAGIAFSISAWLSNTFMIYAALLAAALIPYFAFAGAAIFAPVFAFIQLTLILDVIIYKLFRFHINSMVINLVITPGGLETLGLGLSTRLLVVSAAVALLFMEIRLYRAVIRSSADKKGLARILSRRWKLLLAFFLWLTLLNKGLCVLGVVCELHYITGNFRLFPLYRAPAITRLAMESLGVKPPDEVQVHISKEQSRLIYPRRKLEIVPPPKPLNILIIVFESFRSDVMSKDITPNLWSFSKKAVFFSDHYSGGNGTRFGIFSLFYGMYGNYWFTMLGERRGPVLIDVLKEQGYDLRVFSATELSYPEFRKTCFINVPAEGVYDNPPSAGVTGNIAISARFIEFLKNRKGLAGAVSKSKPSVAAGAASGTGARPYFAFVFFDASHSYESPGAFRKFQPAYKDGEVNYLTLDPSDRRPLFNRYKNSLFFEDSLAGGILNVLERSGGLTDTAVLITGDHGESFFEHGYLGHNRAYNSEEVKVPLLFYLPGRAAGIVASATSHMDIVPSLMRLAGVKNKPADYSSGEDIFNGTVRPFVPVFSWDASALIKNGYAVVMPFDIYHGGVTLFDPRYAPVQGRGALNPFIPGMVDFQKEAKRFYR